MQTPETDTQKDTLALPSKLQIGDPCTLFGLQGWVRAVIFTTGKTRYAVTVGEEGSRTTLHNVDGYYVELGEGEKIDFEFDNYS